MTETFDHVLRAAISDFLDAAPPWHELRELRPVTDLRSRTSWRRPIAGVLAVASVTVGVVGVLYLAGDRIVEPGSAPTTTVLGSSTDAPPTSATPPANPGLRPTVLPDDLRIAQVMLPPPDVDPVVRPASGVLWMVIGRRDSAGDLDVRIALSVDFGRLFAPEVGPMSQWTRESITVARVPGEIVRDGVNGLTIVEYQLGERVIALESRDAADPAVLDAMLEIAGLLTVDEGTAELAGAMPDGFEVLAEAKEPPSDIATTLWYSDGTNVRAVAVGFNTDPPDDVQYWYMADDLAEVVIRGRPAFVTRSDPIARGSGDETIAVLWLERPDLLVTVSGHGGVTLAEVMAAAESLETMSDAEFADLQGQAATSGPAVEVTTSVVPTSTQGARVTAN